MIFSMSLLQSNPRIDVRSPPLLGDCAVMAAVKALSTSSPDQRGAVFTKPEVVEFLLDLTGYTANRPLTKLRLLDPSFGNGEFLISAVERLLSAWQAQGSPPPYPTLRRAICAVELHRSSFESTYDCVVSCLSDAGISSSDAIALADDWLIFGDFLLTPLAGHFDVVVGNPPYVRQELISSPLMAEYRARYSTIYDRADIYVPFIERSLSCLSAAGQLGFICADRWMKNRYGGPLRKMVTEGFHLKLYIDMFETAVFQTDVSAYPAIFVITREAGDTTRIAHRPQIERSALSMLSSTLLCSAPPSKESGVTELKKVATGAQPWLLESSDQLALIRRLEITFPTLEEVRCKVGIGVATGADKAFIGPFEALAVEPDRKLPLAMTRDIVDGQVRWRGLGVVNPFGPDGRLVNLPDYPLLEAYLEARRPEISRRHVAQRAAASWYRTIDRIYPELAKRPKLLIPDIKGDAHVIYEDHGLYPHHNFYFITSDEWDLHALQAVLLSGIARLFVGTYSTKMRGGYLRFQAQYLRRIRIPEWSVVPELLRERLRVAGESRDITACNQLAFELYGLSDRECLALQDESDGH